MRSQNATGRGTRSALRWVAAVLAVSGWVGSAGAQQTAVAPLSASGSASAAPAPAIYESRPGTPSGVAPIGCTSCGSLPPVSPLVGEGLMGCGSGGCGEGGCVAGRPACETCCGESRCARLFCAFHNALCCPDPCYEPRWVPEANAAFFTAAPRPGTYTRFRWDYGNNLTTPDRAEYFWPQIGGKGPANAERRVNYHELSIYAEVGTEKFSFFVDTPYRNVRPEVNGGGGSIGDLKIGTKSVVLDSEALLMTFQFQTYIPTGNPSRGTGVGHVSLEPSLIWALKLGPDTYWQSQLGYWIPISATDKFSGGVLQYSNSLNHVLWRPMSDTALIGTIETTGYTFGAGRFTDENGVVRNAQTTYFNVGPGLRLSICNRVDFGFGMQFALTDNHFADQLYRTELRWRF